MKLFIDRRWGSDESEDGPDGEDTCFLVRADSLKTAVSLVDRVLRKLPHVRVLPAANVVTEIGIDYGVDQFARIILGPVVDWVATAEYKESWVRDPQSNNKKWKHIDAIEI